MRNRRLRLMLSACVLLVLVAGCRETATRVAEPPPAAAETLSIAWMESSRWGKDDIASFLENKIGAQFDFVNLNWSDAIDKLNVMVASGDVPDMFYYTALDDPSTKSIYIKWAEHGVLKPLPDDLSNYPNIRKVLSEYDFMKIGGKHYSIPRLSWQPDNQHLSVGLLVRKDYMRSVGVTQLPRSLDEFVALLKAFRDGDPDGDGKADTIPFSPGVTGQLFLQSLFGLPNGWIEEDGKYIPSYLSDKYLAYTKFVKLLYDEHLIDPDFATEVPDQMYDKFAEGRVGAVGAQLEATNLKVTLFDKLISVLPNPYDVVDMLPITQGPYGDPVMTNQMNHYSATLFSANMSDEQMDLGLRLYDYLLSDEGMRLMRWGLEGEDYREEDGGKISLLPHDEATGLPKSLSTVKPTANLKLLVSWDVDGGWEDPSLPRPLVDLEKKHISTYQRYIQQDAGAKINYLFDDALDRFTYTDLMTRFFNNAVLGKFGDIDEAFRQTVQQVLTERGGSAALRAANAKIAELR